MEPRQPLNLAARAARWSADHWKTTLLGWLAFVVLALAIGQFAGLDKQTAADGATGESAQAERILGRAGFPTPVSESVLVHSEAQLVSSPPLRAAVADVVAALERQPQVSRITSPLAPGSRGQISSDGHSALVLYEIRGPLEQSGDKIAPILGAIEHVQAAHPALFVGGFGSASANHAIATTSGKDLAHAEIFSLPLTLVILVIAFGSLLTAGVPVLLAFSGVLAAGGLSTIASHVVPAADATSSVILMIGLAVGVDYSLFYIRRAREEHQRGLSDREALLAAASTSGQAVLVSGLTVMIALAGMLFTGTKVFTSIATGSMIVVAVALIGSLSVLPAVIAGMGGRLYRGRLPFVGRRTANGPDPRLWSRIVDRVLARPALSAGLAAAVLVALSLPALSLHTQQSGFSDLPKSIPAVGTYDRIQQAFPGSQTPAQVVVKAADVTAPAVRKGIARLEMQALASGQMTKPIDEQVNADRTVARVRIPMQGDGADAASQRALRTLRTDIIPATVAAVPGVAVAVTGNAAAVTDFNHTVRAHMPLVFGFVLLLVFLLLLVTFRSIVIPLKAVVLNVLSVGAAYGILVAVFQHHWAERFLGFHSNGTVVAGLPLFLFVVLFGLSMDYHVFIISRIKELVDGGMGNDEAVAQGIKRTAGVVSIAATIMVAIFAVFVSLRTLDAKQMGFGLGVAVLIDATLIRAVLLPATMKLLGDWNWYLPTSLSWLPTLRHGQRTPNAEPDLALAA